jgi:hypothetical protein
VCVCVCVCVCHVINVILFLLTSFIVSAIMTQQWPQDDLHSTHLHWMPSVKIQDSSMAMISLVSYKSVLELTTKHSWQCMLETLFFFKLPQFLKINTNSIIVKVNCLSKLAVKLCLGINTTEWRNYSATIKDVVQYLRCITVIRL